MKKFIVFFLCALLICTMPIVAFAEGESTDAVVETEVPSSTGSTSESIPEKTITETIVEYVKLHFEEISVVVTLILTAFYHIRNNSKLNLAMRTLNNNAITVAENGNSFVSNALSKAEEIVSGFTNQSNVTVQTVIEKMDGVAEVVQRYQETMGALVEEIRNSEEEKKALKEALDRAESYIHTSKLANTEFANELAELLCLSNIPNSKKEELYARHIKSVKALEEADANGVKTDDGTEA